MKVTERVLFVDFMKAIAIILMVLLHSNYTHPGFNAYVGAFHMAVFFFVAGLFAKGQQTPFKDVVKRSFYQLIIPYFGFSIIGLTYGWVYPYLHPDLFHTDRSFGDIFKKAIIGILLMRDRVTSYAFQPCAALWFLSSLFWCRCLFSIWIHSSMKRVYIERIIIIAFLILTYKLDISIFALNSTAVSFPYFVLGFYLNKYIIRDFKNINVWLFVFLGILSLTAIYFLEGNSVMPDDARVNGNFFLAYLKGILGIAAVMAIAVVLEKSNYKIILRFFKYIGGATLTILGLHLIGIIIFKVIFVSLGGIKEEIPILIAIPVSILITLIGSVIHHEFLNKKAKWLIGIKEVKGKPK